MKAVQKTSPISICRLASASIWRAVRGAAVFVPGVRIRVRPGYCAGVYGAAVRVRQFRRAHRRAFLGATFHIGVFLALLLTHTTFNLSSFMGLIMVVGIVAKNGILLLDADQKFRARRPSGRTRAMIQAGERRLRPIMMTALATVAGMLPLAFAFGAGSQMLQPLAIAVIGGILASMVLSLVVTPAVRYYLGGRNY